MEKKKQRRATTSPIPTDIIREIFLKLEAEAVARFRGVCKSWNEVIQDPSFIKEHLTRIPASSHIIVPNSNANGTFTSLYFSSRDGLKKAKAKEFRYPMGDSVKVVNIVGSCNGIVCLQVAYGSQVENKKFVNLGGFILWNPTTGISRKVAYRPDYNATEDSHSYFGYSRKHECHVVRVWKFCLDDCNVNEDSWTWRTNTPGPAGPKNEWTINIVSSGIFFNGDLYLVARILSHHIIVSFDLSTKSVSWHDLPPISSDMMVCLGELQGSLCVFAWQSSQMETYRFWLMETDGGRKSWKTIVFKGSHGLTKVLPYTIVEDKHGTQKLLGVFMDGSIKWCDFKNKRVTPVHVEGQLPIGHALGQACACLRTLVSPFLV